MPKRTSATTASTETRRTSRRIAAALRTTASTTTHPNPSTDPDAVHGIAASTGNTSATKNVSAKAETATLAANSSAKQQISSKTAATDKLTTASKTKSPKTAASSPSTKATKPKTSAKIDSHDDGDEIDYNDPNADHENDPSRAQEKDKVVTIKKGKTTSTSTTATTATETVTTTENTSENTKANTTKKKQTDHQRITQRDDIPKLWDGKKAMELHGSYTFKILSWNVAGLRALMRNHPTALSDLVTQHDIDVLCLQETKLQDIHVDDPKLKINGHLLEQEGYDCYYNCATAKKGYSGTAVFVKRRSSPDDGSKTKKKTKQATIGAFFQPSKNKKQKKKKGLSEGDCGNEEGTDNDKQDDHTTALLEIGDIDVNFLIPQNISFELGKPEHDAEGRMITLDFPLFTLSNVYVPNSGMKLDRLGYRTNQWDADLLEFMQRKEQERNVPVVWIGDLNVAHTWMDVWNDGAKHLAKSAGTTPEERASFTRQLEAGFVDAFRALHPTAKGHYTYWSQRAGNREPNKGLRLDYFICSKELMSSNGDENNVGSAKKVTVRDCYNLPDQQGSDHCPIVLELEIRK